MKAILVLIFTTLISISFQNVIDEVIGIKNYRFFRHSVFKGLGSTSTDPNILRKLRETNKLQEVPQNMSFPCSVEGFRSESPPENVDKIKPGDIDIIGALGDSLTAGLGIMATNAYNLLVENRGVSWSVGGQGNWKQFLTIPNILKEFNPNLFGYSLGDSLTTHKESQFNVAESFAMVDDMPYMAKQLVHRIRSDPRVKLHEHWKLITYLIGANDFCNICFPDYHKNPTKNFRQVQLQVLRTIRDGLPRTVVNFIPVPNLRPVRTLSEENKPDQCRVINTIECPCLFGIKYEQNLEYYYKIIYEWHKVNREIANMQEFHKKDFTVIYQPIAEKIDIPKLSNNLTDYTYLSQDCFHLSQKFNAEVANGLWNNMLEPEGLKSTWTLPLFEKFLCPTEDHPYIYTKHNIIDIR